VRADSLFACEVAVVGAYAVCRRHCVVGQLVVFCDLSYEICSSLPVGKLFTEECVEYRAACVSCLQVILNIKSSEDIFGKAYRQVA
jgi:hypothetical protein